MYSKLTEAKRETFLWLEDWNVIYLEVIVGMSHRLKGRGSYQCSDLNASLMMWGCISACGAGNLHINAKRYILAWEQYMLPSRQCPILGRPCIFQQDNAKQCTVSITTVWLCCRRVHVLSCPACSPDISQTEKICLIITLRIRQWARRTVEQLE